MTDRSTKRYASSIEVARLAGVSQSAVSRTFTEGASVSAATRAKVLAAADALGFRPSLIPKIMLSGRSDIVAIVAGGFENAFLARALQVFATRLQDAGKQILLVPAASDYSLDSVAARLSQYRVDAIVSALAVLSREVADLLSAFRIPVVSFNTPVTAARVSSVSSDNAAAGRQAAELLARRGARRLAFVAGPPESPASRKRLAGFRAGAEALGLNAPGVVAADYSYAGGAGAADALRRGPQAPQGVFCANDLVAFGLIDALRGHIHVPDDLMVIGYDNNPSAAWGAYGLTSFDQDVPALVTAALALVDAMIEDPERPGSAELIEPILVERRTTRS